jgi:hypothetical protein
MVAIIARGIEEGDVRADVDSGSAADLLIAPLVRAMVLGGVGASSADIERHAAVVAGGISSYAEAPGAG